MGTFKCKRCKTEFKAYSGMQHQASGCSATVFYKNDHHYILGHYGSLKHDSNLYVVVKHKSKVKKGIICDKCIDRLLEEKVIEIVSENNYFELSFESDSFIIDHAEEFSTSDVVGAAHRVIKDGKDDALRKKAVSLLSKYC
jgi:hypothetical protein